MSDAEFLDVVPAKPALERPSTVDHAPGVTSESKAMPYYGGNYKFVGEGQVLMYSLNAPTLTLVRARDTAGVLLCYATMKWSYESHNGFTSVYRDNVHPEVLINFMSFPGDGTVGYPFQWNLGRLPMHCRPASEAFFKTDIDPNIYDITLNWTFADAAPTRFYKTCK